MSLLPRLLSKIPTHSGSLTKLLRGQQYRRVSSPTILKGHDKSYFEKRSSFVASQKRDGCILYPNDFKVSEVCTSRLMNMFDTFAAGEWHAEKEFTLAGRVIAKVTPSRLVTIYGLDVDGCIIQVFADPSKSTWTEAKLLEFRQTIEIGDIIGVTGFLGKYKTGKATLFLREYQTLSYCLHRIPKDIGQGPQYSKRFLEMMLSSDVRNVLKTRAKVVAYIRRFLDDLDFIEVETPIFSVAASAGAAKPFIASNEKIPGTFYMRIAPEILLKQCIVGGFSRVYEMGKQFRAENIDKTHHPEFTTCEFYMTYANYNDLMTITEDLISGLVLSIHGSYEINLKNSNVTINFRPPFKRVDMIEELEKVLGVKIQDFDGEETQTLLKKACEAHGIQCSPPYRIARLLDKLSDRLIGDGCINPTFLLNHPQIMGPMAKPHPLKKGLTERFELFVNGSELINAYSELNDPVVQRQNFASLAQELGVDTVDETFLLALEHGLPPTAGWGIGIDRLVMLLTGSVNIRDVISFPLPKKYK